MTGICFVQQSPFLKFDDSVQHGDFTDAIICCAEDVTKFEFKGFGQPLLEPEQVRTSTQDSEVVSMYDMVQSTNWVMEYTGEATP